ncbi:hypothetical protein [Sphaerotilus uruguayifluvii]|uniref:Uncharacterized protein n=1 Tax=Sphaerotilus uruguayifluvii TaxID=2735897 RepID=A0ABX2G6V9_9BURK|nr:hypothetical protein [Leptothrix sp. C29]NRT58068.1 hypothetical protein [Leptothrix sp. C29]
MSQSADLRYRLERERREQLHLEQMRASTRPFLERHARLLEDLSAQGLDQALPEEFAQARRQLEQGWRQLQANPREARDISLALSQSLPGLPARARAARQAAWAAEAEARRLDDVLRQEHLQGLRDAAERVWSRTLVDCGDALALQLARPALTRLRRQLETRQAAPDEAMLADLQTQLGEVLAQARQQADGVRAQAREQAEQDARAGLREQLAGFGLQADVAQDSGTLAAQLGQAIERTDTLAVDEAVRREVVRAVHQALDEAGFVVERPRRLRDSGRDEVLLQASRPSGAEAEFRIDLEGGLHYHFDRYEGRACRQDIDQVLPSLQEIYGIRLSDQRVIWENPDDRDRDARPLPGATHRSRN